MRLRLSPVRLQRLIKRSLPTTLFGRSLLIIILPVALMQVAVTWVFFDAHWQAVTSRLSEGLAGDVAWAVESYQDDPTPESFARIADRAERSMSLSLAFQTGRTLPVSRRPALFAVVDRSLEKALAGRIDAPFWFDTTRYPAYVDIRVQTPQGVMRVLAPRDRAIATQGHIFVLWMTVATLLLTAISILFIRNQVRAIERLASAADDFGRGVEVPFFKPSGAREVRQAAQAFLAMKARIQRHLDQRTALLASVSHDLRTPLTRLKLELALAEPTKRTGEMKRDLSEMEHMIDEYLAFARGEGGEAVETVRLKTLIEEVSEGAVRAGAEVSVTAEPDLTASVRPNSLKRALSNLIMNAAVHGEHIVVTAAARAGGGVEIVVDDDGPGIPEDRYEEAFKAFSRLDESRNQNDKGVGLGLAIARDVARGHGGDVTLSRSPMGGLRATVRLPG
ncbi:MAG: two-component sensor histidine kinase [Phenylobacterium sp.]|uniref:ATP-binding protein n=1 Tax=Phenylobacterium sp. TaxID=1871053 RepID=UPI001B43DDAB|nr:ATP-binding protein [Phenylobacterium sp.]MBP7651369.1 two-component sensor histidine kinase [Phenylobacterium sp.]MBP7815383.1 two-component sensor histidine kinase [Phenylobacterium sp.]MBP9232875.1 two-component sensor histidine kinase [Phenylobacterium sp.]MBP9754901.1 two-component sensor histidine kinase [Phenylobacterium sp.]